MREGGGAAGGGGVWEINFRAGVFESVLYQLQLLPKWGLWPDWPFFFRSVSNFFQYYNFSLSLLFCSVLMETCFTICVFGFVYQIKI